MLSNLLNYLLVLLIGGGAFYALPWDLALAVDAFLLAVCALFIYLRSKIVENGTNNVQPTASVNPVEKPDLEKKLDDIISAPSPKESPEKPSAPPIDRSVFEEFQKNLEKKEREKQKRTIPPKKEEEKAKEIIMAVSQKAKKLAKNQRPVPKAKPNPYAPRKKPVTPKPEELPPVISEEFDAIGKDIFSDVVEPEFRKQEPAEKAHPNRKNEAPVKADETLNLSDFKKSNDEQVQEILGLIKELENCAAKNLFEDMITRIDIFEAENSECDKNPEYGVVLYWKGFANFQMKNYQEAKAIWRNCFDHYIFSEHKDFPEKITEVVGLYKKHKVLKHGIPFLLTSLNYHRRQSDFDAMDRLYGEIALAYDQLQDTKRLIETLRNHISIRKALKDYSGQLELVDRLGKIFYDQGNQQGTHYCYEQSLRIRKEMMEAEE